MVEEILGKGVVKSEGYSVVELSRYAGISNFSNFLDEHLLAYRKIEPSIEPSIDYRRELRPTRQYLRLDEDKYFELIDGFA